jgi:hypothetical protein
MVSVSIGSTVAATFEAMDNSPDRYSFAGLTETAA